MATVGSGQTLDSAVVGQGAAQGTTLTILSGGMASGSLIGSGGAAYVLSGGVASGGTVSAFGVVVVAAQGLAQGVAVASGGALYVSGGTADATQVAGLGAQEVAAGGIASGGTVAASGLEEVASGGTAYATTLAGGTQDIDAGGIASGTEVGAGGLAVVSSGGVASALSVGAGGVALILGGGSATGATVAGGGRVVVLAGGHANTGTVAAVVLQASEISAWTNSASGVSVASGAVLYVAAGGTADATLLTGGTDIVQGGTASGTVAGGGAEQVGAGGVALGTILSSGAAQYVLSGGEASGTVVASGAAAFVSLGGVGSGLLVGGGAAYVTAGGTASASVVTQGGVQDVAGGGLAVGATLGAMGYQEVQAGGVASASVVAGGAETVFAGGIASAAMLTAGGTQTISSGGTAYATRIGSGGTLFVSSGGLASGGIVFAGTGGVLDIGGTSLPTTTISGFAASDTIDLADIAPGTGPSATLNAATDVLTITQGGTARTLQLAGSYAGATFRVGSDGASGSVVAQVACFAAGTRLATVFGEVAVEDLVPGDYVWTHTGRPAPVRRVGQREVDCRSHPRAWDVRPVRIVPGAFAPGVPRRDVLLSPDHAVFVAGVLIPARYLANGITVMQVAVATVRYCHVELDRHDIVLAEGLAAESFLDTGNRREFSRSIWQADGCADLVVSGPRLAAARRRLLARAAALGHRTTDDPAIALFADGARLAVRIDGPEARARLPHDTRTVSLRSRAWTPAHMQPDAHDTRALGVAVGRLVLGGQAIALDGPMLAGGWHAPEPGWRWTDGAATIDIPRVAHGGGTPEIRVALVIGGRYWSAMSRLKN